MRPAHVAERVNHRENDESKRKCDTGVRNRAIAGVVDDNRPGPGEDESECSKTFSNELLHDAIGSTATSLGTGCRALWGATVLHD